MSQPHVSRKKNIGFKPEGIDSSHDVVYSVLDSLPRGGISDFVVIAVKEYLEEHAGETITGSRGRKYIILGNSGRIENKPKEAKKNKHRNEPIQQNIDVPPAVQDMEDYTSADAESVSKEDSPEYPSSSYTELDEDTLFKLVFNFPSSNE